MTRLDKSATPAKLKVLAWTPDAADSLLEEVFNVAYRQHPLSAQIRNSLYVAAGSYAAGLDPAWKIQTPRQRERDIESLDSLLRRAREIALKTDILSALGISVASIQAPDSSLDRRLRAQPIACQRIEETFELLIRACQDAARMNRSFGSDYHKANRPTRALVGELADIWERLTGKPPPTRSEGPFCDFVERVRARLSDKLDEGSMGEHIKDLLRERDEGGKRE